MASKQSVKYVALVGGHYIDPKTGLNVRFEAGQEYHGPNPERNVKAGILKVVPAPAGASHPGGSEDGRSAG